MKRALLILLSLGIFQFSFGQMTQPSYRINNGIPDVAGFTVVNPTPKGGIRIFSDKDGNPVASPIKIRKYHPEEELGLLQTPSSRPASEIYFNPNFLPRQRTRTEFIAPIPLRDRRLELEVPFEPSLHLMPFDLSPVFRENPIFEERNIRDFNPRRQD